MRRLALFFIGILGLITAITPVAAQGSNIAALVESRSDLSTLSVFLDAAPEIREQLASSSAFTLFAPNDQAFDNLSSALAIPLADLLRSPEIVTAILQYHIIEGSFDSHQLSGLSGLVQTELLGAFVSLRQNDNGALVVNNVVEIVTPDLRASNGRVHIINDVLLNRVIDRLVSDFNIDLLITPNATAASTESTPEVTDVSTQVVATPILTPTPAPVSVSYIRFANFAPESANVEIYLNESLVSSANFGQIGDFQPISPDIYQVRISTLGESEALVDTFSLTLLNGDFKTVILAGVENLQSAVIEEDFTQITADTSRILFYQAVEGLPNIDVQLDSNVVTGGIGFAGRTLLDIAAGDYDPLLTASGEDETIIFDPETLTLEAGNYYLLGLVGTDAGVQWVMSAISSDDLTALRQGGALVQDFTPTPTPEEVELGNILDILEADGNFTILLAALEAAEDDVINRLGSRLQEPVTLLAPTDTAFSNLFSSLGLSQGRVFSNRQILSQILRYHVVDGQFYAEDFRASAGTSIPTLLQPNQAFFVTGDGTGNVFINGRIRFERVDVQASNGVIHVIDDVLLPQSALDAFGL